MSDRRPRSTRPRNRGGKNRLAERAVIERHNQHISALSEALGSEADSMRESVDRSEVVDRIRERATELAQERLEGDVSGVVEATLDEIFGLGPLEPLLRDASVRTIRVEGAEVFAEGEPVPRGFRDSNHAREVLDRILAAAGQDLGASPGGVSAAMMDGSTIVARLDAGVVVAEIVRPA